MRREELIEIRDELQRTGGLRRLRALWIRKCNKMLDEIEEIATSKGKSDELGKAVTKYVEFLESISTFLSSRQAKKLSSRFYDIRKNW